MRVAERERGTMDSWGWRENKNAGLVRERKIWRDKCYLSDGLREEEM